MTAPGAPRGIRSEPHPRCPLCGGGGDWIHTGLVDRLFGAPGEWGYRRCRAASCGLVWIDPVPVEEDLAKAYRDYYTHRGEEIAAVGRGVWAASELLWRVTRVDRLRRRLDRLLLEGRPAGRLLEIGCGTGARLAQLSEAGWEVEGQEIDATAAGVARRRLGSTSIHVGPLADLGLAAESYDAIVSSHVLEHVRAPEALLRECHRLLRRSGVLVAITPNAVSFGHARYGRDWFYLDPPRHLQIFTPEALAAVAGRAGFVATVRTTSVRAQNVAASSLALRRPGLASAGGLARSARDLAALWFQLASHVRSLVVRGAGEECVLAARREADREIR
jgi:2-polyprenyl-3-methyl-5-hydroxy-6-metoxy-1,4-benzoquinol methylase